MAKWYETSDNIAVSTRIRIARNISNYPFPNRLNTAQKIELNKKIVDSIFNSNSALKEQLKSIDMGSLSDIEALSLVEKHLISYEFAQNRVGKTLILSNDESISIMLCEEDHIRIQVIKSGFNIDEAYDIANKIDTVLSENMNFAFDDELGYITACPTNLGTGLRASVMLHLPCLEKLDKIDSLVTSISKIGLTIRGLYGEGSKSKAGLYQISNQVTLGISEKNAIENLKTIAGQIIKNEESSIDLFDKLQIEDTVFRSYGLLSNARILSANEMMINISNVILGKRLGIIKNIDCSLIKLLFETQTATLKLKEQTENNIDVIRADIIRKSIAK